MGEKLMYEAPEIFRKCLQKAGTKENLAKATGIHMHLLHGWDYGTVSLKDADITLLKKFMKKDLPPDIAPLESRVNHLISAVTSSTEILPKYEKMRDKTLFKRALKKAGNYTRLAHAIGSADQTVRNWEKSKKLYKKTRIKLQNYLEKP